MKKHTSKAFALLSLILFLLSSSLSLADQITPNNRVHSRLNVRSGPSRDGDIVATLEPGQTAQLIASVPYWYQVTLDNGIAGFVSKAYAQIVAAAESGQIIRVGSWNIKKLGHGTKKDYQKVAQIISTHFDLVCVIEVMQKERGHPGYDDLLNELGSTWTGLVTDSPRPNTTSGSAEYYAILYRDTVIEPCAGWSGLVYHIDNDSGENGSGDDFFSREPAYACFTAPLGSGAIGVDFLIAAYHARWAEGDTDEISAEVKHIDEVFKAMEKARPGEKDIFIAGDFNLVPAKLKQAVSQAVNTRGSGSTLNKEGQRTTNLYDHFLVYSDTDSSEIVSIPAIFDVRNQASTNKLFYQTISDHLPLVVQISTAGADDD